MALAQCSRDAGAERVVLIAGNGHVRRDLAVPLCLQAAGVPAAAMLSRGYLEPGGDAGPYDQVRRTAAAEGEDPCKSLQQPSKTSP